MAVNRSDIFVLVALLGTFRPHFLGPFLDFQYPRGLKGRCPPLIIDKIIDLIRDLIKDLIIGLVRDLIKDLIRYLIRGLWRSENALRIFVREDLCPLIPRIIQFRLLYIRYDRITVHNIKTIVS